MKILMSIALLLSIMMSPIISQAYGSPRVHVVKMERTSCNGTCPSYVIQIFEDGRVTYFGKKDAPQQGYFEGRIDSLEADALMEKFEHRKIRKAQDQYITHINDVSLLHFQFFMGPDMIEKNIRQANFGPGYLIDLGNEIDLLLKDVVWQRATDEATK